MPAFPRSVSNESSSPRTCDGAGVLDSLLCVFLRCRDVGLLSLLVM